MDVTTIPRPQIATPTVVDGDLFFRQGGDQLNDDKGFEHGHVVAFHGSGESFDNGG